MNNENKVSMNYEAECERLKGIIRNMEDYHKEETSHLHRRIAELEKDLMLYEHKWSVIELIFGK